MKNNIREEIKIKKDKFSQDDENKIYKFIEACAEDLNIEVKLIRKVEVDYNIIDGIDDKKTSYVIKLIIPELGLPWGLNINDIKNKIYSYALIYEIEYIIIIDVKVNVKFQTGDNLWIDQRSI